MSRRIPILSHFFIALVALATAASPLRATETRTVLSTTFPIHQVVRIVAEGREGLRTEIMLPAEMGCPHSYSLTPADMRKLSRADILVVNGLGMEDFLGGSIHRANPDLVVIDSSAGIDALIVEAAGDAHACAACASGGHGEHAHLDHSHGAAEAANPHLFASPTMLGHLARNVATQLGTLDPAGAELYQRNAEAFSGRMDRIRASFAELGGTVENPRIITQHGIFDYLARDAGLEPVANIQGEPGQQPSAATLLDLVRKIREEKVGAIVVEPQYPDTTGRILSRETGIPLIELDPAAAGPENAPLDYLEKRLLDNLERLRAALRKA